MLADTLYTKAKVPPTNNVCLWLGVSKFVSIIYWNVLLFYVNLDNVATITYLTSLMK
jgi:hypothetical protein